MNLPLPCSDSELRDVIQNGQITLEQEQRIAEHLKHCAQCRAVVELLTPEEDTESESQNAGLTDPRPEP